MHLDHDEEDYNLSLSKFESMLKTNSILFFDSNEFENIIHYTFKDRDILDKALRHSSYVNEQSDAGLEDNERLEFLGDRVLGLVMARG